jgi:GT2 family glycosyltransferase/glycosyltransferase involved in cell wall biosynthesis
VSAPRIGLVVVSYGSSALLATHLAGTAWPDRVQVVVVDNHSGRVEAERVEQLCGDHGYAFVGLPDNRGFAAGCNAGADRALELGCTAVVLLNPDASADPGTVLALGDAALERPRDLVGPAVSDGPGVPFAGVPRLSLHDGRIRSRPEAPLRRAVPWLSGACVALSAELLRRLGGLPEGYFLYWEDVELSTAVQALGGAVVHRPDLVVRHDEGGTHGPRRGRGKSALYYRWNTRNRLVFAARTLPRRDVLRWLLATPAVSREILLRGGRRQLLADPRLVLAAARGSLAGAGVAVAALLGHRPAGSPAGRAGGTGRRRVLVAHPGAELYGSDRVLLESVAGLVAAGDQVTVTLPGEGPLVAALRAVGAEVVPCPVPVLRKALLRPAGAGRALVDAVRWLPPAIGLVRTAGRDGVLVNTLTLPSWVVLARLLRRPVLLHVHEAESAAPAPLRAALARPARWATRVVVNSRFSLDVLTRDSGDLGERACVVPNAVPGPPEVVPPRAELDGPARLLFIGRLSPRKGPQVAVAVLAGLVARGVDAQLTLLGDVFEGYGWFRTELEQQVEAAGLEDRVEWAGFRPDVWPVLAAADVVLVPSTADEPFGNTAVEASLAARPVVVSDRGGLVEAVAGRRAAHRAPVGDERAWTDLVAEVLRDWPAQRAAAVQDAVAARADFDPQVYRRRFVAEAHRAWGRA